MEATKRERRREEETMEEALPESFELPPEIIREILIRLPAKSIGRFRCVSKLFCSLSSDPGLAKSQLDLTISRPVHRKIIVSSHNLYALELDSIGEGSEGRIIREDLVGVELNYPLKDEPSVFNEILKRYVRDYLYCGGSDVDEADRRAMLKLTSKSHRRRNWVEMVGSSYGLLCISPGEGALFLYNPTTGESKSLPGITPTQFDEHGDQFQTYGFGYDHLTRDYKVVKLVADFDNLLYASVYSLKSGSWTRVRDLSYEHNDGFNSGVSLNGALHWVFTLLQANHRVVLAFNIQTEEFRDMPLPAEAEDCPHRFKNFVVGNLNGRLCVINSCYELHDDVWVMKEYGVVSSWTRIRISLLYRSMKPLCSTKNSDEVLLEVDGDMVLYNLETDASRNLGIQGVKLSDGFEANTYLESIISPNSFGVERTEEDTLVI